MRDAHLIAGSILLGSAIIGAALYLGLRSPPPPPAPSLPASAIVPAAPAPTEAAAPISHEQVEAQAAKALDAQKPTLRERCWDPAHKKKPTLPKAEFVFEMVFDGKTGQEIARGIREAQGTPPDVAICLRDQPMGLRIDPPGKSVKVEIPFTLP